MLLLLSQFSFFNIVRLLQSGFFILKYLKRFSNGYQVSVQSIHFYRHVLKVWVVTISGFFVKSTMLSKTSMTVSGS